MAASCSYGQLSRPCCASSFTGLSCRVSKSASPPHQNAWRFSVCCVHSSLPRRNFLDLGLGLSFGLGFSLLHTRPASAEDLPGFRTHIDKFDGYSFSYPGAWIQVRGAGADVFYRDPVHLDENVSVEISSPTSSRYKQVGDLGTPDQAAQKVLKQYLTEFMSTRIGVRRESNILSASSRLADDGNTYYEVQVNVKSYANNQQLAVMPQDRVVQLEWDRRYLSVLGVQNNRLYELRLQAPEYVFSREEGDLRKIMDSFRAFKV